MTRQTPNRLAAQRRDVIPHTPRSGVCLQLAHAAQRRLSSLATRRAAACVFTFLTRRAAACVFTSLTPRSGVFLHFPHAAKRRDFTFSHAAQRRVPSPRTRRAAACVLTSCTPRSGVFLHFRHAAQRRVFTWHTPRRTAACACTSHTPRSGVCLHFLTSRTFFPANTRAVAGFC